MKAHEEDPIPFVPRRVDAQASTSGAAPSSSDLPRRARLLLLLAGGAGIVFIVVGSLIGGMAHTVRIDKIIHFSGYAILAFIFMLALRPVVLVPGLAALVAMGFAIEHAQSWTGRTFDPRDATANALGVAVGAAIALVVRGVYAWLHRAPSRRR